jgi:hypothetical protein
VPPVGADVGRYSRAALDQLARRCGSPPGFYIGGGAWTDCRLAQAFFIARISVTSSLPRYVSTENFDVSGQSMPWKVECDAKRKPERHDAPQWDLNMKCCYCASMHELLRLKIKWNMWHTWVGDSRNYEDRVHIWPQKLVTTTSPQPHNRTSPIYRFSGYLKD